MEPRASLPTCAGRPGTRCGKLTLPPPHSWVCVHTAASVIWSFLSFARPKFTDKHPPGAKKPLSWRRLQYPRGTGKQGTLCWGSAASGADPKSCSLPSQVLYLPGAPFPPPAPYSESIHQQVHLWALQTCAAIRPGKENTTRVAEQKQPLIGNHLDCS